MRVFLVFVLALSFSLFAGCRQVERSSANKADTKASPANSPRSDARVGETRLVFAAHDGSAVNLYFSDIDGSNRTTILAEHGAPSVRDSFTVRVSPDHKRLAVSFPYRGDFAVYEIDADGQQKQKLLDRAIDFHWSPEGKRMLYFRDRSPLPQGNPLAGAPPDYPGYEWRLLDLQNASDETVTGYRNDCGHFLRWTSGDYVLFDGTSAVPDHSFVGVLDLAKRKFEYRDAWRFIENAPAVDERWGLAYAPFPGLKPNVLCELTPNGRLSPLTHLNFHGELVAGLVWNGENDLIYGLGRSGAAGKAPSVGASTIYEYQAGSGPSRPILASAPGDGYFVQGIVDGKVLVVVNASSARSPTFILETGRRNGSHQVPLVSSQLMPVFYGWIEP
ncbi:MAG TPA: hypothetical protein VLZ81_16345 [Blastocatellia bacterium]|nr:hypothetical protein [Blastocatellia bacterium]